MIKGKIKKQVLQFTISRQNSKGKYEDFTIRGVFEGDIEYDFRDHSPYLDEKRFGGEIILKAKTDHLKDMDVWSLR